MGWHRGDRRPDRILQAPAQPRQAVHGHGRHLARELPPEELPDGLSHPALVLLAAGSRLPRLIMRALSAFCLAMLLAASAAAQTYPSRPVRIVIPLSPGGTTDVPGRIIAQKLSESLGQQFFVENRAGAGGTIGSDYVAKAKPDGYTLLLTASPFVIAPHVYKTMPYDPLADRDSAHEIGAIEGAGREHVEALARDSRGAYHRRGGRPRLRGDRVDRPARAGGNAARHRREVERRSRQAGARRGGEEAHRPDRHGARPGHARAVRRLPQGRLRQVGQGGARFGGDRPIAKTGDRPPFLPRQNKQHRKVEMVVCPRF